MRARSQTSGGHHDPPPSRRPGLSALLFAVYTTVTAAYRFTVAGLSPFELVLIMLLFIWTAHRSARLAVPSSLTPGLDEPLPYVGPLRARPLAFGRVDRRESN